MAKTVGPLMSLDASGTVAGTITFSKWKGRNYVRQRVIPANPQTAAQTGVRSSFAGAVDLWKKNQVELRSKFESQAEARGVSTFNAFTGATQRQYSKGFAAADNPEPTNVEPSAPATAVNLTTEGKYLVITWTDSVDADAWANNVYLKLGSAPSGIWQEIVGVIPEGVEKMTLGPLAAGEYHVQIGAVSKNGGIAALTDDKNATIT